MMSFGKSPAASAGPMLAMAAGGALALAVLLQSGRNQWLSLRSTQTPELLYVRSPEALRRIVLGFDAVAADVYWIRAVQHYGGERLAGGTSGPRYELLYPLLDMTTSLDPYFNIAYRFGAIFLSEPYPGGAGRPDLAIALLQKAVAVQPTRWHYYHDLGFVHYWALQDASSAAAWFRRGAALPDAPNWLLPVAAGMLTETNDRTSARLLWRQILQADEEWLRKRAERGLLQIDALDEIDRLTTIIASAPKPVGQPYSWIPLVRSGVLRGIPIDPAGTPYELDPATGRVSVATVSPLYPMPAQKERVR